MCQAACIHDVKLIHVHLGFISAVSLLLLLGPNKTGQDLAHIKLCVESAVVQDGTQRYHIG